MNKQSERQQKYDETHTVRIGLKLNTKTDADILYVLDGAESKQGFIKEAVREYMKSGAGEQKGDRE